jgi:uncharacterized protein YkwD
LFGFTRHSAVAGIAIAAVVTASAAPAGGSVRGQRVHRAAHHRHTRRHRPTRHHAPPPPARCANADAPATASSLGTMRDAVVCLINQQRTRRGLPALGVSDQLNRSAQGWTTAMIATGQFTHGADFAARITAVGYDWQSAGENIATGYPTPRAVVTAWMASTDHCQNILDPAFRDVGTGESDSPVGTVASGPATWTQDFGLPMSASAPSHNHGPQTGCPYH